MNAHCAAHGPINASMSASMSASILPPSFGAPRFIELKYMGCRAALWIRCACESMAINCVRGRRTAATKTLYKFILHREDDMWGCDQRRRRRMVKMASFLSHCSYSLTHSLGESLYLFWFHFAFAAFAVFALHCDFNADQTDANAFGEARRGCGHFMM